MTTAREFGDMERPHRNAARPWLDPPLPSVASGERQPANPVTERTVTPEEAKQLGIRIHRPTVQEIAAGLAAGQTLAEIADAYGADVGEVADRARRYRTRTGVTDAQLDAANKAASRERSKPAPAVEPAPAATTPDPEPAPVHTEREEEPDVAITREQVEKALAEHETQRKVAKALGVALPRLRDVIEGVGVTWPWQGRGLPRLDRMPETAPKADKPEPVPAIPETTKAEPETRVVVHGTAVKAEARAPYDVGDVPLGPPPQLAGTPDHGGLLIELPQTTLDRNSVDRLLSQLRDTITTASSVVGGEVELQLTARVGVGARG